MKKDNVSRLPDTISEGEVFKHSLEVNEQEKKKGTVERAILILKPGSKIKQHLHPVGGKVEEPGVGGVTETYTVLSEDVAINGKPTQRLGVYQCGLGQWHGAENLSDVHASLIYAEKHSVEQMGYKKEEKGDNVR